MRKQQGFTLIELL
ncbi:MAG TPA: prepilin-type N-terminal cleavage/methylation domain-containing protein, partial [Piscirickettsiaceae bacterium]|nr:prepilin-type N-terminal cleavage/methylation domain-containing protein [Piscirickettsiaceae bacterium]